MADTLETNWLERFVETACLWEATARKAGNVHPERSFPDLTYADFVKSARAVAPVLAQATVLGVGRSIRDAVAATRAQVASNTNLGIVLLIAPLAAVSPQIPLPAGIAEILANLTTTDAEYAYEAIRLVNPGGMGKVEREDVHDRPTLSLREAMHLAADRDLIAAEYISNFSIVLNFGLPFLRANRAEFAINWEQIVVRLHLEFLSGQRDSLIERKCGRKIAEEASRRARALLDAGRFDSPPWKAAFTDFDDWLRQDGHRRNPGTTADLVAATLFAALREGVITPS